MTRLTYTDLSSYLVEILPELGPAYEAECRWWGNEAPGTHIVYADVLTP